MIAIRAEIRVVEEGKMPARRQPAEERASHRLAVSRRRVGAPLLARVAAFPTPWTRARINKFWPAVGRINNAQGDRHLRVHLPGFRSRMYARAGTRRYRRRRSPWWTSTSRHRRAPFHRSSLTPRSYQRRSSLTPRSYQRRSSLTPSYRRPSYRCHSLRNLILRHHCLRWNRTTPTRGPRP
jgi:hypothetical protein